MTPPLLPSASAVATVDAATDLPMSLGRPATQRSVDPDRLEALALALFDVRAAYEADLRALTAMQRYLERLRSERTSQGERELLLGEIARLLDESDAACRAIAELRREAHATVESCRAEGTAGRHRSR